MPSARPTGAATTTTRRRRAGGSTGTNLWGAFALVAEMLAAGRPGSVVTLLCDGGERYAHTYYSDRWLAEQGLDLAPHATTLETFARTGEWRPGSPLSR